MDVMQEWAVSWTSVCVVDAKVKIVKDPNVSSDPGTSSPMRSIARPTPTEMTQTGRDGSSGDGGTRSPRSGDDTEDQPQGCALVASWRLLSRAHDWLFRGIDSERGIVWRCSNSLSLREFMRLANREKVLDHSWLSKTHGRLLHEVHDKVFAFVLKIVAERCLVKGERMGIDGSTMEANAAMRAIVRRDNGETYREMLMRMAKESGVKTPTIDDLARLDRARQGKLSRLRPYRRDPPMDARICQRDLGSGTHRLIQKMIVAAMQIAEKKVCAHRS